MQNQVPTNYQNGNEHKTHREKHYRPLELASLWGISDDKVRHLFEGEPGVVVIRNHRRGKRQYRTVLYPESVVARVHRKLQLG